MSYITVTGFEAIFKACMKVNYVIICNNDENEIINSTCTRYDKEPKIIIRYIVNGNEQEFNDFSKAYDFFNNCYGNCRVMDVNGTIYLDAYK